MTGKQRKKLTLKERKMTENRLNDIINNNGTGETELELEKIELSGEQGLAVHLLQEREKRQNTVLEMNELLKELDKAQAENAALRRALYQERLNAIAKDNADLRKQYSLPEGNAQYAIEDGKMFLVKKQATPKLSEGEES